MTNPTAPLLTESEVEELSRLAGDGSLQFPLRVEHWHKSLTDGGWYIRQSSGRIVMTIAFVPAEIKSGIPARDGNAPARTTVALLNSVPALIRDWRALKARIEALTTDWCQCGHSRDKHQFFSDHDECYECDQASEDLCCEWRPAPRPNENAALREQLAETELMPWLRPALRTWSIVGMNHYVITTSIHLGIEERWLYVAMTKDGVCIRAQHNNELKVWDELERKANSYDQLNQ